jgi:hypothetical protein
MRSLPRRWQPLVDGERFALVAVSLLRRAGRDGHVDESAFYQSEGEMKRCESCGEPKKATIHTVSPKAFLAWMDWLGIGKPVAFRRRYWRGMR